MVISKIIIYIYLYIYNCMFANVYYYHHFYYHWYYSSCYQWDFQYYHNDYDHYIVCSLSLFLSWFIIFLYPLQLVLFLFGPFAWKSQSSFDLLMFQSDMNIGRLETGDILLGKLHHVLRLKKHQGLVRNSQKHRYHVTLTSQECKNSKMYPYKPAWARFRWFLDLSFILANGWMMMTGASSCNSSPCRWLSRIPLGEHLACLENPKKKIRS